MDPLRRLADRLRKPIAEAFAPDVVATLESYARHGSVANTVLDVQFDGQLIDSALATELRTALAANAVLDKPLTFTAMTFQQREGAPNRNYTRIRDGAFRSLANSGANTVFLRDHAQRNLDARAGTILSSSMRNLSDADGVRQIVQRFAAQKPWAQAGVLDGTIDRFSVGWIATDEVLCTACKTPVFAECYHFPGDESEGGIVEWEFQAAELVETSAVNVPAVMGTGIEEVRAALAAASPVRVSVPATFNVNRSEDMDIKQLAKLYGLPETATEADVLAAAHRAASERELYAAQLAEQNNRIALIEAQAEQERIASRAREVDATIERLYAEGRLAVHRDASGKRVESKMEALLRKQAQTNYEAFNAYVADMPQLFGVIRERQAGDDDPNPKGSLSSRNPALPGVLAALGLSEQDVIENDGFTIGVAAQSRDKYQ